MLSEGRPKFLNYVQNIFLARKILHGELCPLVTGLHAPQMGNPCKPELLDNYRCLKLFTNANCPLDWNSNPMFCANSLLPEKTLSMWIILYFKKHCRGQLGLYRMGPSKTLCTRLVHTSPSWWKLIIRLKLFSNWNCPLLGIQIKRYLQILCWKKHKSGLNYIFLKYLIADVSSGSNG